MSSNRRSMHNGGVVIVGAAESTGLGTLPTMSDIELHVESARNAMADAGLTTADIDGVATDKAPAYEIADHLGITPRWIDGTSVGGCSFMLHVRHAAAAIAAGAAKTIIITHGESGRSRVGSPPYAFDGASVSGQFEYPYGALMPYSSFTVPVLGYLAARGLERRDLAEVVAAQRVWATPNERAMRRTPITVAEVLEATEIAYPFTRDMCCVVSDGGGALILTSAERARDMPGSERHVYLLGSGESAGGALPSQIADRDSFAPFRHSSDEAFRTAGLSRTDIDHVMFYDAFAHLPLYMLEDSGFVGRGESGDFIRAGNTLPGGSLPMNTNGGGLSYTHTGKYGMFAIQEAVRQLRGEAAVQAPGVQTSFVQGVGMMFGAAGALVLSNVRP